MIRNFFKIAFRNILTHRSYALFNIAGLTVGITFTILVSLFVIHELSYDRFIDNADLIYRLTVDSRLQDTRIEGALVQPPASQKLLSAFPEIKTSVRIAPFGAWLVSKGNQRYNEDKMYFADSTFFDVFSYPFIYGRADGALSKPKTVVITQQIARQYFGAANPVGDSLRIENDSTFYTITGVIADLPVNTHFHFNMIASLVTHKKYIHDNWMSHMVYTYFKTEHALNTGAFADSINQSLLPLVYKEFKQSMQINISEANNLYHYRYGIQKLTDIHLYSSYSNEFEDNSKAAYVYTFAFLAIIVLVIASFNFMNIATAHSAQRFQEVQLRKIMGSERVFLILQFIFESIVFSFIALLVSLIIVELTLPIFNTYLGLSIEFEVMRSAKSIAIVLLSAIGLGILSGIYPAISISSFQSIGFENSSIETKPHVPKFRYTFIILQLGIGMVLAILTLVIHHQYYYLINANQGFDNDNLMVIRRSDALGYMVNDFKKAVTTIPGVIAATHSSAIPGEGTYSVALSTENTGTSNEERYILKYFDVASDFFTVYTVPIIEGRNFRENFEDDTFSCYINQTAAEILKLDKPIGATLRFPWADKRKPGFTIIGVTADFHFEPLNEDIKPLVFFPMIKPHEGFLTLRLASDSGKDLTKAIETEWGKYAPHFPFVYYNFKEHSKNKYNDIYRTVKLFLLLSILSFIIACVGVFGVSKYQQNIRQYEVNLRKMLGAPYMGICTFLLRDLLFMLLLASLWAWIAAYYLSSWWLTDFYYHTGIRYLYFPLGSIVVSVLAISVLIPHIRQLSRSKTVMV